MCVHMSASMVDLYDQSDPRPLFSGRRTLNAGELHPAATTYTQKHTKNESERKNENILSV